MSIMLQQQLFQVIECSLVRHSLSHLHYGMPGAGGKVLLTILALLITDSEFNKSCLCPKIVIGARS